MIAGAGSGKTTSLVKALDHIQKTRGPAMRRKGQKIACITYTEIAAGEIWNDVGNDPLVHVSTIHSFLWTLIKPFQHNIRAWVAVRIDEKLNNLRSEQAGLGPRVQQKRRDRIAQDIVRYEDQRKVIGTVRRFTYGTGSDYPKGILGHDDILKLVPSLITEHELLRQVATQKYPYIFVDESQDTSPIVVSALKALAETAESDFTLGFIGDPMQKIYATGIGEIALEEGWVQIDKPENFRCPQRVLSLINAIRAGGDPLKQTGGRTQKVDGVPVPVQGSARLFILPADDHRTERVHGVREWLAHENADPLWLRDDRDADVKLLVIAHRMAATRLGFGALYSALNDRAPTEISEGFSDGTLWAVRPFLNFILPIVSAHSTKRSFEVMRLLRANSPLLIRDYIQKAELGDVLDGLQKNLAKLGEMLMPGSSSLVVDVLTFAQSSQLLVLEDRLASYVKDLDGEDAEGFSAGASDGDGEDTSAERTAITKYFACAASQMWAYRNYIEDESPFSTQQGIKGAEFARVLTILDDEEGRHNQFSYDKYLGLAAPSDTDRKHIAAGEESVYDRTRRLLYVCCSRAVSDLAVVLFTDDPERAKQIVGEAGLFQPNDVHVFQDIRPRSVADHMAPFPMQPASPG
jgi:DNA helicase-2/ATP-dependent DNA helicase PcrA